MSTVFPPHLHDTIASNAASYEALEQYWQPAFAWLHNGSKQLEGTNIYDGHPYLFVAAFPSLSMADIQPLADAARTFAWSVFLYDPVMDEGSAWAELALRGQALQFEAYRQLHRLFPPASSFWERFRGYLRDYLAACGEEQRFMRGARSLTDLGEAEALALSIGKNGVARAAVAGLAALAGDDAPFAPLVDSIDEFYTAHQILDDLADWKKDLRARIPTLVFARVAADLGDDFELDERSVARSLFARGQADLLLGRALAALDRADQLVAGFPDLVWRSCLVKLRARCEGLRREIADLVAAAPRRAPALELPDEPADRRCPDVAWRAIRFVSGQLHRGFAEVAHTGLFPIQESGFRPEREYLSGHALAHAVILDVLHDAAEASGVDLTAATRFAAEALLAAHDPTAGGWPYFTTLPELPPGADVFGHAAIALVRAGHGSDVLARAAETLAWIEARGAVPTWLRGTRDDRVALQAAWIRDCWGAGPDAEAIAPLARALHRLDPARFRPVIARAVDWIERAQEADGGWPSQLCGAPYLTTWQCAQLLAEVRPGSPARARARDFLLAGQLGDGGWANHGDAADPIVTAHALLGLCASARPGEATAAVSRGYARLHAAVEDGWPASTFVALVVGRARGGRTEVLAHRTSTVTAAYVAKAAIAVEAWVAS